MKRGPQDKGKHKEQFLRTRGENRNIVFQWYWAIKSSCYVCEHILDIFVTADKLEYDSYAFHSGTSPERKTVTHLVLALVDISFL